MNIIFQNSLMETTGKYPKIHQFIQQRLIELKDKYEGADGHVGKIQIGLNTCKACQETYQSRKLIEKIGNLFANVCSKKNFQHAYDIFSDIESPIDKIKYMTLKLDILGQMKILKRCRK